MKSLSCKALLVLAALAFSAPVLVADESRYSHNVAASAQTPPEALWLTEDQALTVASGACAEGSNSLCAIIVGLNTPEVRAWADEICGLPIFWDLVPEAETGSWKNGRILDLETQRTYPLGVTVTSRRLSLHIARLAPIHWQMTTTPPVGCAF